MPWKLDSNVEKEKDAKTGTSSSSADISRIPKKLLRTVNTALNKSSRGSKDSDSSLRVFRF